MTIRRGQEAPPRRRLHALGAGLLGGLAAAAVLVSAVGPAAAAEPTFPTAQAAMAAFKTAIASDDPAGLLALFGNEHEDELLGGDPASRREEIASMASGAQEALALDSQDADHATILIGREAGRCRCPLVKDGDGWHSTSRPALEEIIDRRIGRNGSRPSRFCATYVDAQVEYASHRPRTATRCWNTPSGSRSSPGKHDGLYWPTVVGEAASPFGPLVAEAEEYLRFHKKGEPYQGYFFRILTAPGQERARRRLRLCHQRQHDRRLRDGRVARRLRQLRRDDRSSCSHQGKLYQKDLGPETARIAADMKAYDPGSTWTLVAATQ